MLDSVSVCLEMEDGSKVVFDVQDVSLTETKYGFSVSGMLDSNVVIEDSNVSSCSMLSLVWNKADFDTMKLFKKEDGFEVVGVR